MLAEEFIDLMFLFIFFINLSKTDFQSIFIALKKKLYVYAFFPSMNALLPKSDLISMDLIY